MYWHIGHTGKMQAFRCKSLDDATKDKKSQLSLKLNNCATHFCERNIVCHREMVSNTTSVEYSRSCCIS